MASREVRLLQAHIAFNIVVPCHAEFFNRVIEAFPKNSDGLLGTLDINFGVQRRRQELLMLRNIADFPLRIQAGCPAVNVLSRQFCSSVELLIDSIRDAFEGDPSQESMASLLDIPPFGFRDDVNFSGISTSQLFAAEMVRMANELSIRYQLRLEPELYRYYACTMHWLRTKLAELLGIQVLTGAELRASARSGQSIYNVRPVKAE
ncbi:hypothetical protein VNI00_018034 [Paramarasmius palmivorus]|uniref:Uncharacterized protein n=1 Tax=Paramarasmius palmivorus TaxID=297713 RepID=A0AAW0B1Q4_9AGAR